MDNFTLNNIKRFAIEEYAKTKDGQHNFEHAERVAQNALWIAEALKAEDALDKNLLKAACYLHDLVIAQRFGGSFFSRCYNHFWEKYLNKKYFESILKNFNLTSAENKILSTAIVNHPYSIPYGILNKQGDIYSKILQDADSLDYLSEERKLVLAKGKLLTYFINKYLSWVRKNIKKYLNFPELIKKFPN